MFKNRNKVHKKIVIERAMKREQVRLPFQILQMFFRFLRSDIRKAKYQQDHTV